MIDDPLGVIRRHFCRQQGRSRQRAGQEPVRGAETVGNAQLLSCLNTAGFILSLGHWMEKAVVRVTVGGTPGVLSNYSALYEPIRFRNETCGDLLNTSGKLS